MMQVSVVDRHDLGAAWPLAIPYIEAAISYSGGEMTLDDVLDRLLTGELRLMVGMDTPSARVLAAFVIMVAEYPRYRAVRVLLAGGEPMAEWIDPLISELEGVCITIGAKDIEFFGRPGFTRALRDKAFEVYTVMVRSVDNVQGRIAITEGPDDSRPVESGGQGAQAHRAAGGGGVG